MKWWLFATKMYYIYGKNLHAAFMVHVKNSLLMDLSKFAKIMQLYGFFSGFYQCAQSQIMKFHIHT